MKNAFKLFAIIALAGLVGFSMTACPDGNNNGGGDDDFVAVTSISGVPTTGSVGTLALTGTVNPSTATNKTIAWSVVTAGTTGASISGATLTTTAAGTAKVKATIANGTAAGTNYTQDFDIAISAGNNGGPGDLEPLSITILRSESTATNFVFSVNQITGATYEVRTLDGEGNPTGSPIGTWAGTKATITGNGLNANTLTGFSVKAVKDSEDASLATKVPGMVKYADATKTLNGYTDWFHFLDATLTSLFYVVPGSNTTEPVNLRIGIRAILNNNAIASEADAGYAKTEYETAANSAMTKVLNNWTAIWADLNTPEAAADLVRVNSAMPRIWFNADGLISADNCDLLDEIMIPEINLGYPDVATVN